MSSFPALDVALGLILVYFLLSVIVSATNEAMASRLNWRARDLERAIRQLLGDQEAAFRQHALIKTLVDPKRREKARKQAAKAIREHKLGQLVNARVREKDEGEREAGAREEAQAEARATVLAQEGKQTRLNEYPSYIPARTFVAAVLDRVDLSEIDFEADPKDVREAVKGAIGMLPASETREALLALYDQAEGDLKEFRRNAERWYDDAMERVSGWYRRRVQWVIFAISAALVLAINADSLQIAKHLWTNPAARTAIANAAANTAATGEAQAAADTATPNEQQQQQPPPPPPPGTSATEAEPAPPATEEERTPLQQLDDLPLPLGWHWKSGRDDPQGIPVYWEWISIWAAFSKLLGLALTTAALMLGAPFWFDTLSKLARLRSGGAPPPASDAVRRGEGEETRLGTPATFVIQAAAQPTGGAGSGGGSANPD
jgi:hypothetical protein